MSEDIDIADILFGSDEEAAIPEIKTKPERPSSREALADMALSAVLPRALRNKIVKGRPACVIHTVPEPTWADPIEDAIAAINSKAYVIRRDAEPKLRDREDGSLSTRLESGRTVIGVSPVKAWLPQLLLDTAETRIEIPAPDAELVSKVLRICQRGRIPADASGLNVGILTFDQITSMIVAGETAAESVARMSRAIAARTVVGTRTDRLPRLEDAIEYGDARTWAMNLRDDLAGVLAGKIGWEDVDRGCVLHGPPGTGKTMLARMLGQDVGIPVVTTSVSDWFASTGGYLNEVIKAQRKAFQEAKSQAPAILFLDEMNSLPSVDSLGDSRNADYWKPVILDFYTLLDGAMEGRDGVIVIGATNRLQDVHPAILRPGRLEREIYVGPPDAAGVANIMRHHLGDDLVDESIDHLAALDAARFATGAVIMEQVRAARRLARRAGRSLTLEDLTAQIVSEDARSPEMLMRVAIHEAGHVVASRALDLGLPEFVTVIANGASGGMTHFENRPISTRDDYERAVTMLLAGRASEHVCLGAASQGAGGHPHSDLARATSLIGTMLANSGLGGTLSYLATNEEIGHLMQIDREFRARVEKEISALYDRAYHLIGDNRERVEAFATALVERKFLSTSEIESITGDFAAIAA